jgi:hypothetical protein
MTLAPYPSRLLGVSRERAAPLLLPIHTHESSWISVAISFYFTVLEPLFSILIFHPESMGNILLPLLKRLNF